MPRHSPCALISLTIFSWSLKLCLFLVWRIIAVFLPRKLLNELVRFVYVVDTCFSSLHLLSCFIQFSKFYAQILSYLLVGTSGLEPPTSRLSGVRSNHLSYAPIWLSRLLFDFHYPSYIPLSVCWWRWGGSNSWPPACKAGALPAELRPHIITLFYYISI